LLEKKESVTIRKQETWVFAECAKIANRKVNIAICLLARDYKGFGNQEMNGVIEY